jgi:hypothetical protein
VFVIVMLTFQVVGYLCREMEKVLAFQVGNKFVDVCHHDTEFGSGFIRKGSGYFINSLAIQKARPDVCTDWIQAEESIFADIENDCAVMINDRSKMRRYGSHVSPLQMETCLSLAQCTVFTWLSASAIRGGREQKQRNSDGSSGWFSDEPGEFAIYGMAAGVSMSTSTVRPTVR